MLPSLPQLRWPVKPSGLISDPEEAKCVASDTNPSAMATRKRSLMSTMIGSEWMTTSDRSEGAVAMVAIEDLHRTIEDRETLTMAATDTVATVDEGAATTVHDRHMGTDAVTIDRGRTAISTSATSLVGRGSMAGAAVAGRRSSSGRASATLASAAVGSKAMTAFSDRASAKTGEVCDLVLS